MDAKIDSPNSLRSKLVDLNDVEMIGTPNSPKNIDKPDVHMITNERKHVKEPQPQPDKAGNDINAMQQPLLEPDRGRQKPPLAGPEVDDLDDEKVGGGAPYPGIDDGLLEPGNKKPNGEHHGGDEETDLDKELGDGVTTDDGKWWKHGGDEPDFAYGDKHKLVYNTHTRDGVNGFGPRSYDPERPISPMIPGSIPDVNTYQQKKNLAQGMMDLALLSANANQLRYVLESSAAHPYFYPSVVLISLSIVFQVAVGVGLIMNSRYNVKNEKDICKADKINNMTVLGIFLVTIVNVFITSFSVATPNTTTTAVQTIGTG